jgi:hypothetical protein
VWLVVSVEVSKALRDHCFDHVDGAYFCESYFSGRVGGWDWYAYFDWWFEVYVYCGDVAARVNVAAEDGDSVGGSLVVCHIGVLDFVKKSAFLKNLTNLTKLTNLTNVFFGYFWCVFLGVSSIM